MNQTIILLHARVKCPPRITKSIHNKGHGDLIKHVNVFRNDHTLTDYDFIGVWTLIQSQYNIQSRFHDNGTDANAYTIYTVLQGQLH